jgi:hypothetical protein
VKKSRAVGRGGLWSCLVVTVFTQVIRDQAIGRIEIGNQPWTRTPKRRPLSGRRCVHLADGLNDLGQQSAASSLADFVNSVQQ